MKERRVKKKSNNSILKKQVFLLFVFISFMFSCSTSPAAKVKNHDLTNLRLDRNYKISNSSEEILVHLNREGEVVFEAESNRNEGEIYYIRIMATPDGLKVKIVPKED